MTRDITRDEILQMPAGREIDALVAKYVTHEKYTFHGEKPSYSTDIAAAWDVAEKVGLIVGKSDNGWVVSDAWDDYMTDIIVHAPTAPLAICRAALLAALEK